MKRDFVCSPVVFSWLSCLFLSDCPQWFITVLVNVYSCVSVSFLIGAHFTFVDACRPNTVQCYPKYALFSFSLKLTFMWSRKGEANWRSNSKLQQYHVRSTLSSPPHHKPSDFNKVILSMYLLLGWVQIEFTAPNQFAHVKWESIFFTLLFHESLHFQWMYWNPCLQRWKRCN